MSNIIVVPRLPWCANCCRSWTVEMIAVLPYMTGHAICGECACKIAGAVVDEQARRDAARKIRGTP